VHRYDTIEVSKAAEDGWTNMVNEYAVLSMVSDRLLSRLLAY